MNDIQYSVYINSSLRKRQFFNESNVYLSLEFDESAYHVKFCKYYIKYFNTCSYGHDITQLCILANNTSTLIFLSTKHRIGYFYDTEIDINEILCWNNLTMLRYIVDYNYLNIFDNNFMTSAIRGGNLRIISALVKLGASLDMSNLPGHRGVNEFLIIAICKHDARVIKYLIKHSIDIKVYDRFPLNYARRQNCDKHIIALLKKIIFFLKYT